MDLHVIAEGVETKAEADFLRSKGCDEARGYYFARPMPFSALMQWLDEHATKLDAPAPTAEA